MLPVLTQDTCFCSSEHMHRSPSNKRTEPRHEVTRQLWRRQDWNPGLQALGQAWSWCSRNVLLLLQRGIMGFGKSSPFLALSILVLCQAGGLQATPLR